MMKKLPFDNQRIVNLLARRQFDEAAQLASDCVNQFPDIGHSWLALSQVAEAMKKAPLACKSALKAVSIEPNNARFLVQLARAYLLIGQSGKALVTGKKAHTIGKLDSYWLDRLGVLFFKCGDYESSTKCHQQAYEKESNNLQYLGNFASVCFVMGNFAMSESLYHSLLEKSPLNSTALLALSQLKTATAEHNNIATFTAALANYSEKDYTNLHQIHYAIAKEYEDMGNSDLSFKHLQAGAHARRQIIDYKESATLSAMQKITQLPTSFFEAKEPDSDNDEAIFVLGLPRSGTTLVEQIIASHSDVFAAGELHNFYLVMHHLVDYCPTGTPINSELVEKLLRADMSQLGRWYIESTRPRTGHSAKFIDKLPTNSLYAGFIHKSLPNAKIVLVDRHPMDVCYANYKMNFRYGYDYSYDLAELGRFYVAWKKLMDYWASVIPKNRFYRISYEKLVANQSQESQKLIEFCGLPWQQACLNFHNGKKGVATASAAQVRKPIYKTSVAKWKRYQHNLKPLKDILLANEIKIE